MLCDTQLCRRQPSPKNSILGPLKLKTIITEKPSKIELIKTHIILRYDVVLTPWIVGIFWNPKSFRLILLPDFGKEKMSAVLTIGNCFSFLRLLSKINLKDLKQYLAKTTKTAFKFNAESKLNDFWFWEAPNMLISNLNVS